MKNDSFDTTTSSFLDNVNEFSSTKCVNLENDGRSSSVSSCESNSVRFNSTMCSFLENIDQYTAEVLKFKEESEIVDWFMLSESLVHARSVNDLIDGLWVELFGEWKFVNKMCEKIEQTCGFDLVNAIGFNSKNPTSKSCLKLKGLKREAELSPAKPLDCTLQIQLEMDELGLSDCQVDNHVEKLVTKFKTVGIDDLPSQNPFSSKFAKIAKNGAISREKPYLHGMNMSQTLSNCSHQKYVDITKTTTCPENVSEADLDPQVMRNSNFAEGDHFSQFSAKQPNLGCSSACVKVFCTAENRLCVDPPNGSFEAHSSRDLSLQPSIPDFNGLERGLDHFSDIQSDFSTPSLPLSNENGEAVQVRFSKSCSTMPQ